MLQLTKEELMKTLSLIMIYLAVTCAAFAAKSHVKDDKDNKMDFAYGGEHAIALSNNIVDLVSNSTSMEEVGAVFDEAIGLIAFSQPSVDNDKVAYGFRDPERPDDDEALSAIVKLAVIWGKYINYKRFQTIERNKLTINSTDVEYHINQFATKYNLPEIAKAENGYKEHLGYIQLFAYMAVVHANDFQDIRAYLNDSFHKNTQMGKNAVRQLRENLSHAINKHFNSYDLDVDFAMEWVIAAGDAIKDFVPINNMLDAITKFDRIFIKTEAPFEYKKINSLKEVLEHTTPETLVLLDIGDTLLRTEPATLVEKGADTLLAAIKEKAKDTFALTSLEYHYKDSATKKYVKNQAVLDQLENLGLSLKSDKNKDLQAGKLGYSNKRGYEDGVIFAPSVSKKKNKSKITTLKQFFKNYNRSIDDYDQVIFVDDLEDSLSDMDKYLKSKNKASTLFHFNVFRKQPEQK